MEEYDYKLSQNNPALVLNGIRSLVKKIRILHDNNDKNEYTKYYNYLIDKCLNKSSCVSSTAIIGLLSLTEGDPIINSKELLTYFLSSISIARHLNAITQIVFHLIFSNESVKYAITGNQHPLITLLKKDETIWPLLLSKIYEKLETSTDKDFVLDKLQPLALFILYDYDTKINEVFQTELLDIYKDYVDNTFIYKIISFLPQHLTRSIRYCKVLQDSHLIILQLLIKCIREMFVADMEASEAIIILKQLIKRNENNYLPIELMLLTDCLRSSPIIHFSVLLNIVKTILINNDYPNIIVQTIKAAVLPWKLQFSIFDSYTKEANDGINFILSYKSGININTIPSYLMLDFDVWMANVVLNNWLNMENMLKLEQTPEYLLNEFSKYFLGILYENADEELSLVALDLLLKCCKIYKSLSTDVLAVVLYRLANQNQSKFNLSLLKALPELTSLKENWATVVTTIQTIASNSKAMQTVAITLLYNLVLVDKRYFLHLQELLLNDAHVNNAQNLITKAYVLKELCRKNISLPVYGKELADCIAQILNYRQNEDAVEIAHSLALDALRYLCHFDIINVISAWKNISEHFLEDTRVKVVVSLCDLMGEVGASELAGHNYDKTIEDCLNILWNYTLNHDNIDIVNAAYKNIGCFTAEQISQTFPACYLPQEEDGTVEKFIGNIPGECWVNIMVKDRHNCNSPGDLLILFIKERMRHEKINFFDSDSRVEPVHMPVSKFNILGAVAKYAKQNATKRQNNEHAFKECLRILTTKYSKALPPMDWSFLEKLVEDSNYEEEAITIAARQAAYSTSARRIIENYIAKYSQGDFVTNMLFVYNNIYYLGNSIQPIILKPFMKNSLEKLLTSNNLTELNAVLINLKQLVEDENILGANKLIIYKIVTDIIENMSLSSEAFEYLLQLVVVFPLPVINELSCPKQYEQPSETVLLRCLKIRMTVACQDSANPFQYLDSFIECRTVKTTEGYEKYLSFNNLYSNLEQLFIEHSANKNFSSWLLEIITKIQLELADKQNIKTVEFIITVFIITVIVSTGYNIFITEPTLEMLCKYFPYALADLLNTKIFIVNANQILEWMYDLITNKTYKCYEDCEIYQDTFKYTLLMLRNNELFNKNFKWMKYIEINL